MTERWWKHKLTSNMRIIRRLVLIWSMWVTTVVLFRVTDPDVIKHISAPMATISVTVIGLVTTFGALLFPTEDDDAS